MKQKALKADDVLENVATSNDVLNWHRVKEERDKERTEQNGERPNNDKSNVLKCLDAGQQIQTCPCNIFPYGS